MGKIIAGKTSDIPPGKMIKVSIDGRDILVANIDGKYFATDDSCTHDCIKKIEVLEFSELGMEAVWKIEVENFPAFIVIDNKGNDFFKN